MDRLEFERRRTQVELKAMVWCSNASAAGQGGPVGPRYPDSKIPTMSGPSTLDVVKAIHRDRRLSYADRISKSTALVDAELKRSQAVEVETVEQFRLRIVTTYEGVRAKEVARMEASTVSVIAKIRRDAGRDGRRGWANAGTAA